MNKRKEIEIKRGEEGGHKSDPDETRGGGGGVLIKKRRLMLNFNRIRLKRIEGTKSIKPSLEISLFNYR